MSISTVARTRHYSSASVWLEANLFAVVLPCRHQLVKFQRDLLLSPHPPRCPDGTKKPDSAWYIIFPRMPSQKPRGITFSVSCSSAVLLLLEGRSSKNHQRVLHQWLSRHPAMRCPKTTKPPMTLLVEPHSVAPSSTDNTPLTMRPVLLRADQAGVSEKDTTSGHFPEDYLRIHNKSKLDV